MGLLDDAIREHMELKRLRGADPSVLARQEQDALGSVLGDEPADADLDVTAGGDGLAEEDTDESQDAVASPEGIAPEDGAFAEESSSSTPQGAHGPDFANVGQETAELDMRLWFEQRTPQDFDFDK